MSKKKIGVIGCGHISDTHIKSWNKTKNSEVFGLFDIDEKLLATKAKKYGIENTYTSLDELIAAMGLDKPKIKKLKELQAPMPGRIVNVAVAVGDELNVGDEILSLEAMKMENVLKAEGIGVVKSINIGTNDVVDKGSVLIEFE